MITPEVPFGEFLIPSMDRVAVAPDGEYKTAGIYSHGRGLFTRPVIYGAETSYKQYNRLYAGQFIYSKLFGWEGALSVVPQDFEGLLVSHEFPTFTIDSAKADVRYIARLTQWPRLHSKLRGKTTGVGSRRQRVNVAQLMATSVPLPSLDEQRRIATKLDRMFTGIGEATRHRKQVKSLRTAFLHSFLHDLPGRPLADFLTPITDTIAVTPEGSYQTAGIYSHGRGLFTRPVIYGTETSYKQYNRLRAGQFVYSKLFGWEGALAVVPEEFDGFLVSHEFPTFTIDHAKADVRYVAHLVRWPELHSRLRGKTTGVGSRRQRVNVAQLLAAMVPLPDLDKQRWMAGRLDRVAEAAKLAEHQESLVSALRQSLLNAAFSGEL